MVGDFLVDGEEGVRARIIICSDKPLSTAASNKSRHNGVAPLVRDPITLLLAPRGQCRQWNRNKTKSVEENRNRYGGTRRGGEEERRAKEDKGDALNAFCPPSIREERRKERLDFARLDASSVAEVTCSSS